MQASFGDHMIVALEPGRRTLLDVVDVVTRLYGTDVMEICKQRVPARRKQHLNSSIQMFTVFYCKHRLFSSKFSLKLARF